MFIRDIPTRQLILNDFHTLHTGGHARVTRMFNNVKKYYFLNGLYADVQKIVQECDECQKYKHSRSKIGPLTITSTASTAFETFFFIWLDQ